MPNVAWAPQAGSQVAFLACPVREVLYEGTRGSGKTGAMLMDFAQHCGLGFGAAWQGVLFRRTTKQLENAIVETKKTYPRIFPSATYNEVDKRWRWPKGESLSLRYMERPSDYSNYHGHEYTWIGFEELTTWPTDECWKKVHSLNRSPHPGIPLKLRSSTNPSGVGHNWVKARYNLPTEPGHMHTGLTSETVEGLTTTRTSIRGHWSENKILLAANPDYPASIAQAATSPAELEAWLHGSWDVVSGGMFDDVWQPHVHVVDPFPVPRVWRVDRSFDWGSSHPFSIGWWAESDGSDVETTTGMRATVKGDLFRIGEWYGWTGKPNQGQKLDNATIAHGVVERELSQGLYGRVKPGPADSQIWAGEPNPTIASDMLKPVRVDARQYPGIRWTKSPKGPGSRVAGWQLIRDRLEAAVPLSHGARENPGLFVFGQCAQFRRTIPVLPRCEKNPDDVDTDSEDHIADEVRYRLQGDRPRSKAGRTVGMY